MIFFFVIPSFFHNQRHIKVKFILNHNEIFCQSGINALEKKKKNRKIKKKKKEKKKIKEKSLQVKK